MNIDAFKILVSKYLQKLTSFEEELLLMRYYRELQQKDQKWDEDDMGNQEEVRVRILDKIRAEIDENPVSPKRIQLKLYLSMKYVGLAASILLILGVCIYFVHVRPLESFSVATVAKQHLDAMPGTDKAFLTLSDGSVLQLGDSTKSHFLAEDGVRSAQIADGILSYPLENLNSKLEKVHHNLTTPKGGRYHIKLPDGTNVWLNSSSSIRYSIPFDEKERSVELTGEGYFEVATNAKRPFLVKVLNQQIKVLGTQFNINAYLDEQCIKTTLVEGSVQLSLLGSTDTHMLRPGQQYILKNEKFERVSVDVNQAIAWKDNYFVFEDEPLSSIMRRLARWYNVDVVYEGQYKPFYFSGTISGTKTISEVLRILELTGNIKYRIEDSKNGTGERRVVIMM